MPRFKPSRYTASPQLLLLNDALLFLRTAVFIWPPTAGLPSVFLPILPFRSKSLDELYPSTANYWAVSLQIFLTVIQSFFLLSLIPSALIGFPIPFYPPIYLGSILAFLLGNRLFSVLLNGRSSTFQSNPSITKDWPAHPDEYWVFINGVAAGSHWLQSNLDRLALTFRRPIHGLHNKTMGILFDLFECVIQRDLSYATQDIRTAYAGLSQMLSKDYKKVVLILHSQGGIEGGIALDWLYAMLPDDQVSKLEVYTFANAANHFNSPIRSSEDGRDVFRDDRNLDRNRLVRHIEHYANTGDWVSKFGILNFRPGSSRYSQNMTMSTIMSPSGANGTPQNSQENWFVGRLFEREGSGHLLNANYLDNIFRMDPELRRVLDSNEYMDAAVDEKTLEKWDAVRVGKEQRKILIQDDDRDKDEAEDEVLRVRDLSRLWMYRNGGTPED